MRRKFTLMCYRRHFAGLSLFVWVIRTGHQHGATEPSPRLGGLIIRPLWPRAWPPPQGYCRSAETTPRWMSGFVAVTTEHGFPYWRATGSKFRGWVMVKNGNVAEGKSLLHSGLTA